MKKHGNIRTINADMKSDIHAYLRGGTYTVSKPILFETMDSGKNGRTIYYENYPDEIPVISGGAAITGWMLFDAENNIYRAKVSSPYDNFRQLYVDGQRAVRARTPNFEDDATKGEYYLGGKWNYLNLYQWPAAPAPIPSR